MSRRVSKILVVDDEPDYLNIAAALLESKKYEVIKASTGLDGLAMAVAAQPALIILDIGLPDISGLEVNRRLKKDPKLANVPVLLFTVRSELDLVKQALREGAAGYMIKPFDPEQFLLSVKKYF